MGWWPVEREVWGNGKKGEGIKEAQLGSYRIGRGMLRVNIGNGVPKSLYAWPMYMKKGGGELLK